jgi:hypothetical protein
MAITFDTSKQYHVVSAHAPGAELDYGFDWSDWLATGETVTTSTWAEVTASDDFTLTNDQNASNITSVFFNGGVEGKNYTIQNTVVTSDDREDNRIIEIQCRIR